MEASPVAVRSAHITQLGLHRRDGQASTFARRNVLNHPEWQLDKAEQLDWSKWEGTVFDASCGAFPNLGPIVAAAHTFACLTILCLKKSGVVDIELLQSCAMLVHLDLSSNEIINLVNGDFWASFKHLMVVLLHGNKVIEWSAVGGLGKAPKLTYLTLLFNPICKRKMYRTFTTNCCESLRALDLHAVSDEEVVESFNFSSCSRFKACSGALALPQPLFKGLTELTFHPLQQKKLQAYPRTPSPRSPVKADVLVAGGGDQLDSARGSDALVLASVLRRIQLLRKFHARQSPVIIAQRQIRRLVGERLRVAASVKIQACSRRWIVKQRAIKALEMVLKSNGDISLVEEIMTPSQLRSLVWFQRRIVGRFRLKVLVARVETLKRFVGRAAKRFSAFVDRLEIAQVGGVVVAQDQSGELATAVTKALVVTTPGLTWVEATERTTAMVVTVPDCRCLRSYSYVEIPDWPILAEDVGTDGVFVTRSGSSLGARAPGLTKIIGSGTPGVTTSASPPRPSHGLGDIWPPAHARHRPGMFGSKRVRECKISRKITPARRLHREIAADKRPEARADAHEQLWLFRPPQTRLLARVLSTLRNGSAGRRPVLFIPERHLRRCASATRIQAAWRGHLLRSVMLDTLASCVIVARAGVCIQRWWRYQRGLLARLRSCRRLWALASAVWSPTMYVELDVYYTLTRGWQLCEDGERIVFTFEDEDRVAVVRNASCSPFCHLDPGLKKRFGQDQAKQFVQISGAARDDEKRVVRELPLWVLSSIVQQVSPSEIHNGSALCQVGALLTVGVKAKRVIWPLAPAAAAAAADSSEDNKAPHDGTAKPPARKLDDDRESLSSASFSTGVRVTSASKEAGGRAGPCGTPPPVKGPVATGTPLDLGMTPRGKVELLELTFANVEEARARAVLLALCTEEPGARPNRPIAQLMTLEMLRRAAAGEPGRAAPILEVPAQGFRRGDAVEVEVFRLSEGRNGVWLPAVVDRRNGYGSTYQVTLESRSVQRQVTDGSIRPRDTTGRELALVEISHLPSRWQRHARALLTPADRLELEILRRSLPGTAPAESPVDYRAIQLYSRHPCKESACISINELRGFNGLDGERLVPAEPRKVSPGRAPGRSQQKLGISPVRWASSQTMSASSTVHGLATEALEKVARAAAAANVAAIASTWVPGNRFRAGLERLVRLAAHEAQDTATKAELRARRDTVSRVRQTEHARPSPRDKLDRLKAAEAAIFRRESKELYERAAFERAILGHELRTGVTEAREHRRDSRRRVAEALEAELADRIADSERRESEVEGERRRVSDKHQGDVKAAKERAVQWRESRAKQALRLAESRAFTANASELARHMGKHAVVWNKSHTTRGKQNWVKDQKMHKEDMRRRMLRRVQELQEQKRSKATTLRRALAARGRARAAMDVAVVRHRAGQPVAPGDDLMEEVLQVLKPRSNLQCASSMQGVAFVGGDTGFCQFNDGDRGGDGARSGGLDKMQSKRPAKAGNSIERRRSSSDGACGGTVPSRPGAARLRSRELKNRHLYASDGGKTVVVLASIPRVTAEARPARSMHGKKTSAALLGSKSNHSATPLSPTRDAVKVMPDQAGLPWPLGRRCW